jgi:hypothetical protein
MLRTIVVVIVVLNLFLASCSNSSNQANVKSTATPQPSVVAETDSEWFDRILRAHPSREINTELRGMILARLVRVEAINTAAQRVYLAVRPEADGSYLLTVNRFYLKFETEQQKLQAFVCLRHEYQHILQMRQKRWFKKTEIASEYRQTRKITPLQAKEWGTAVYRAEVEAYLAGCDLADKLRFSGDDYCDTKKEQGELAFRLMVAKATVEQTITVPGVPEAIKEAWEEDKLNY